MTKRVTRESKREYQISDSPLIKRMNGHHEVDPDKESAEFISEIITDIMNDNQGMNPEIIGSAYTVDKSSTARCYKVIVKYMVDEEADDNEVLSESTYNLSDMNDYAKRIDPRNNN